MKYIRLIVFLLTIGTAYSQADCTKYPKDYIPKNLEDALRYLDCVWTDKESFKNKSEADAVGDAHFAGGQWMRNGWELWEGKNSLYKQFKSLGITFPEDMSSIILTSFHRRLNHQDINLTGQIEEYKQYKKKAELAALDKNKLAKQLKMGDTVDVVFSRNKDSQKTYGLALLGYETPLLKRGSNCHIQGLVKKKSKEGGSSILTIEVVATNNCDSTYLHEKPMVKGQQFPYNMTYFNLKRHSK